MAYTPENNPYIPGDPYSYDLKWQVEHINRLQGRIDDLDAAVEHADIDSLKAEGYAVGTQDGEAVDPGSPYYENNAKFYRDASKNSADDAANSASDAADSASDAHNSELAAKDYADHIADPVSGIVTDWLTVHITNPSNPPIDTSLTVAGSAADAKVTGTRIELNDSAVHNYQYDLTFEQGAIGGTGSPYASLTEIRTDFIPVTKAEYAIIQNTADSRMYVFAYDDSQVFLRIKKWGIMADDSFISEDDEKFFRIMVNYIDHSAITPVNNAAILKTNGILEEIFSARNGYATIGKRMDALDAEYLPDYYFTGNYISDKISDVQDMIASMDSGIAFGFITDMHIPENSGMSKNLMKRILDSCPVPFLISGGDIVPAYSQTSGNEKDETFANFAEWKKWIESWNALRVYQMRGNHDLVMVNSGSGLYYNMPDYGVNQFISNNSRNIGIIKRGSDKYNYFTFDVEAENIRFIVLDPHLYVSAYPNVVSCYPLFAQCNWLIDQLMDSDGKTIVIMNHETIDPSLSYYDSNLDIFHTIVQAYEARGTVHSYWDNAWIDADFSSCTGELACVISGHAHTDESHVDNGVLSIVTTCDAFYGKTLGTTGESAFDIFTINTTSKEIKTVRIGAGSDRSWTY